MCAAAPLLVDRDTEASRRSCPRHGTHNRRPASVTPRESAPTARVVISTVHHPCPPTTPGANHARLPTRRITRQRPPAPRLSPLSPSSSPSLSPSCSLLTTPRSSHIPPMADEQVGEVRLLILAVHTYADHHLSLPTSSFILHPISHRLHDSRAPSLAQSPCTLRPSPRRRRAAGPPSSNRASYHHTSLYPIHSLTPPLIYLIPLLAMLHRDQPPFAPLTASHPSQATSPPSPPRLSSSLPSPSQSSLVSLLVLISDISSPSFCYAHIGITSVSSGLSTLRASRPSLFATHGRLPASRPTRNRPRVERTRQRVFTLGSAVRWTTLCLHVRRRLRARPLGQWTPGL